MGIPAKLLNEKVLLRQVARHDEKAFKALFETYQARLYHYIIHIIKSREAAEEMVIDVFLKIWQQRESLHEIESFDAYLFRIAFNKSVDFLRRACQINAPSRTRPKTRTRMSP